MEIILIKPLRYFFSKLGISINHYQMMFREKNHNYICVYDGIMAPDVLIKTRFLNGLEPSKIFSWKFFVQI